MEPTDKEMVDVDMEKQKRILMAEQETEVHLFTENSSATMKKTPSGRRKSFGMSLSSILNENYIEDFKAQAQVGESQGKGLT